MVILKRLNMKLSSLLCCCKVAEDFTLQKMNYSGINLRIEGYFFREIEEDFYELFFLFEDGVFLSGGAMRVDGEEKTVDDSVLNFIELGYYKNNQYGWGIWIVENDQIVIEKWLPGSGGPYPVGRYVGEVLNDSTINIAFTYQLPPEGDEEKQQFTFREFSPKPDSTNTFIE